MSNIVNKNIRWFPVDVGELKSKEFVILLQMIGEANVFRFLKLREAIYDEGFFFLWNDINSRYYCFTNQYNIDDITNIIKSACVCGLFNRDMFEWYGVITSFKIQKNFFRVVNRRIDESVIYEYLLIPRSEFSDYISPKIKVINLQEERVDIAKPQKINRPKKKIFIIQTPNLFTNAAAVLEISADRQSLFDQAIQEFPVKSIEINHHEDMLEVRKTTPWEEIVKIANTPYTDLPSHIKSVLHLSYFESYSKLINTIDNKYSSLHKNKNPITWKEWSYFLKGCKYDENQTYGGLNKMAANNVPENGSMIAKLTEYIEWFITGTQTTGGLNGQKVNSNPNNVPMLTPEYKK